VYVPGFSFSVSDLEPAWNVGVAPSTVLPCATVTLCSTGDMFAIVIVTGPAFALSCLVL
jgi:hypothetical protein